MKRVFLALLAVAALSGCDNKSSSAQMPEFYVYKTQPICLAEVTSSEQNPTVRKGDTLAFLTALYRASQGWSDYTVVGVDYVDFKKMTLVIKGACTDQAAVDKVLADAKAANGKYSATMGGDAALVGDADAVMSTPSPSARFAALNPDAKLETCLLHFKLPRAVEDVQDKIPHAITATAVEFRFPVGDVTSVGDDLYMLLARDCGKKAAVAENIAEALHLHGMTDKEVVLADTADVEGYLKIRPEKQGS